MNKQGKQVKGEEVLQPEESILGSCKHAQVIYFAQAKLSRPWPRELEKYIMCMKPSTPNTKETTETGKYSDAQQNGEHWDIGMALPS